eukprot:m.153801 g.153801  ORF g.153801 m.153801 type:complete len:1087 (-) comp30851_c1_seq1:41-3301(-)
MAISKWNFVFYLFTYTTFGATIAIGDIDGVSISNNVINAVVTSSGLASITSTHNDRTLSLANDSFSVELSPMAQLNTVTCVGGQPTKNGTMDVTIVYECSSYSVEAHWWLPTSNSGYVSKQLKVMAKASSSNYTISSVQIWGSGIQLNDASGVTPTVVTVTDPFNSGDGQIASFVRFNKYGAFFSVTNPFTTMSTGANDGVCTGKQGVNYRNGDMPLQPTKSATTSAECERACNATAECVGFVWNQQGCESTPAPGYCFLKATLLASNQEPCSCSGVKPFSPPAPTPPTNRMTISATYNPNFVQYASSLTPFHLTDAAVIGVTVLGKYMLKESVVYMSERKAFVDCVEEHYLDGPSRQNKTVKVNVAWDENDYQIDVGTEDGRTEYKRIIDRNAEFGVSHIVYEPANTLHSSRFNTTDGWGWEGTLWFSMGEQLREGRWDPTTDAVPSDIMEMVDYAEQKGVKLMAYVYPCLHFAALSKYFVGGGVNILDLSRPEVQDWMISRMTVFMTKTRAGGFAWDHDIYAGDASLHYAQWRGWMRILGALRESFPEMVMDHRQTAHMWGPWYHLAGSYTEPIAGDENPETYGVPIASLHTDHVAADNTRIVNYKYSALQLLPSSRIPGFVFHQTERTADNGTNPCFSASKLCYDNNIRDFDLLGYKYSLLSTIGTAGQNNVLTMIPARDEQEFQLFPQADVSFIQHWLAWTDVNVGYLRNTVPIASLGRPAVGQVDGTSAMLGNEGFLFLFNPGFPNLNTTLTVDEAIGLSNETSATNTVTSWDVMELYPSPQPVKVGQWFRGDSVVVNVGASDARVLQLVKSSTTNTHHNNKNTNNNTNDNDNTTNGNDLGESHTQQLSLQGVSGVAILKSPKLKTTSIEINSVVGASGSTVKFSVGIPNFPKDIEKSVTLNGKKCQTGKRLTNTSTDENIVQFQATFNGASIYHGMPISDSAVVKDLPWTGGWMNVSFTIPSELKQQALARAKAYPVSWTDADAKATWLVQTRLLMYFFVVEPDMGTKVVAFIDENPIRISQAFNSRGLVRPKTFLGIYYDASNMTAATHTLALNMPACNFQGVFWENVETPYTSTVVSC